MVSVRENAASVLRFELKIADATGRVFVDVETRSEIEDLIALLARTVERGRADGAAEAQSRDLADVGLATNCDTCAAALTEEPHRADCAEPRAILERERASALVRAVRRWADVARDISGPADVQIAADIDLAEAVEAFEAAQPRDLAGRIRGLIQEYAGRWCDSFRHETSALREAMGLMRDVVQSGAHVDSATMLVEQLRAKNDWPERRAVFREVADELEAIVRDCEAQR